MSIEKQLWERDQLNLDNHDIQNWLNQVETDTNALPDGFNVERATLTKWLAFVRHCLGVGRDADAKLFIIKIRDAHSAITHFRTASKWAETAEHPNKMRDLYQEKQQRIRGEIIKEWLSKDRKRGERERFSDDMAAKYELSADNIRKDYLSQKSINEYLEGQKI